MYIFFLVPMSSSLLCKFLFFSKYHHKNIIIIELKNCNNDKAVTASQLRYCNSPTVAIGVTSIKTKNVIEINVMVSLGYLNSQKNTLRKSRKWISQ